MSTPSMHELALLLIFPAFMAFAGASDLVTMTIPNRVGFGLVAGFLLVAAIAGLGVADLGEHVLAGLIVLAIGFGFFACGWIGGGDAKLAASTALWLGLEPSLLDYVVSASLAGGLLTLLLLKWRRMPLPDFAAGWSWVARLHSTGSGVPYGIALSLAGLAVYPETSLWQATLASLQ